MLGIVAYPAAASYEWVAGVFFLSLVLFHGVMVHWLKISKRGWSIVDYFWVSLTALGLIGTVGQVRQTIAVVVAQRFDRLAPIVYDPARFYLDWYKVGNGPACRTFVRSEWSPPKEQFDRIQKEYDSVCAWFKDTTAQIPVTVPIQPTDLSSLLHEPVVTDVDLKRQLEEFRQALVKHNESAGIRANIANDAARSDLDWTWLLLSPFLIAVGVALRLTKVTGELRLP